MTSYDRLMFENAAREPYRRILFSIEIINLHSVRINYRRRNTSAEDARMIAKFDEAPPDSFFHRHAVIQSLPALLSVAPSIPKYI